MWRCFSNFFLSLIMLQTTQFTHSKDLEYYEYVIWWISLTSTTKGSPVATLARSFKQAQRSVLEKNTSPTQSSFSYHHSAFTDLSEKTCSFMGGFLHRTCTFTVLTSLSAGVTNRLLQVNEVNWLLLTFSWSRRSWDRGQSSVSAVI